MGPREILSKDVTDQSSWYGLALKWLFNQGVSTIILMMILYGIWDLVPAAVVQYSEEAQRARQEFREINEKTRQEFREDLSKVTEALVNVTAAIREDQNERRIHDEGS